ncbi:MAG: zf-HC2 domain-containing protein, partial [Asticcacaulis sp.]
MTGHPEHHPAEDMLWDFHRGALKPGLSMVVRAHLDLCPHCREEMRLFDAIGGAMLDDLEGVPLTGNGLDLALARIERPEEPAASLVVRHPAFLEGFE